MEEDNEIKKVHVSQYGKYTLITFTDIDQIDLYNVNEIKEIFEKGNNEGVEDWIIDLSNITHIDSSGLGGLANQGMLLSKKSKQLNILKPRSGAKHLFSVTGFQKIFKVIDNMDLQEPKE